MICLLLINDIIVFIRLVLSEDLGSVNLSHELYMYVWEEYDLLSYHCIIYEDFGQSTNNNLTIEVFLRRYEDHSVILKNIPNDGLMTFVLIKRYFRRLIL